MPREPLLTGQIDMLLLAVLSRSPAHGYAIIEKLREGGSGLFDLPEGTVYPALYRLEALGLVTSDVRKFEGRVRRTYRISKTGLRTLRERESTWRRIVQSVDAILRGDPAAADA
jgi:DNA-binding PadR family transcriptional regulator